MRRLFFALIVCASCSTKEASPSSDPFPLQPGSPWPKFRGNAAQDGHSELRGALDGVFWSYRTGKGIFSSPVVAADGTIYVGSADRNFYALTREGTLRWKVATGEIIDSAALLDDRGRVYFGSGDGKLRALDAATGSTIWTTTADAPATNKAFINWFEGNVAIDRKGNLRVPNDNFFLYTIERNTGEITGRQRMPDQTWSLPAIDGATGRVVVGNNNLLPALGRNTFAWEEDGSQAWDASTLGSVAASPMLTPEGLAVVGGFDGFVHAYDGKTGDERWSFATRDHVYASPARLPDGTIVQPSTDGVVYALDPASGNVRWTFDVREPVRSSPAVDGDGNVYFGGGDGRLWVLRSDGTLRWAIKLIDEARNDLNASPALGKDAIYIAGESGDIFSIPYDFCLRAAQKADPRCSTPAASTDGARLLVTTEFGAVLDDAPKEIEANEPIALTLSVRDGGLPRAAILDAKSITVTTTPATEVNVDVAGDGKFVVLTPKTAFPGGPLAVEVKGSYLVDLARDGLRLSGGHAGGTAATKLSLTVRPEKAAPALTTGTSFELSRLALPLPTLLPSYNQIGFDSLHYVLGVVEGDGTHGVAWMAGAMRPEGSETTVIDPATKALLPLAYEYVGGRLTLRNEDGLVVEVMNATIPFRTFRVSATLGDGLLPTGDASLTGSTICEKVPFYGPFLKTLGLCNPQTDVLSVLGAARLKPWIQAPQTIGATFELGADEVVATLSEGVKASDHVASVLLVDAATGNPVTLDYGLATKRDLEGGLVRKLHVPIAGKTVPESMRAYVMVDVAAAAHGTLSRAP
ncbi:MAG: outer membrane protein assembly factor BamB family protein [Polyangiales bacterium]